MNKHQARFVGARCGMDPVRVKGQVCRGAYIADSTGLSYLGSDGEWRNGAADERSWFDNIYAAKKFLKAAEAKAKERSER